MILSVFGNPVSVQNPFGFKNPALHPPAKANVAPRFQPGGGQKPPIFGSKPNKCGFGPDLGDSQRRRWAKYRLAGFICRQTAARSRRGAFICRFRQMDVVFGIHIPSRGIWMLFSAFISHRGANGRRNRQMDVIFGTHIPSRGVWMSFSANGCCFRHSYPVEGQAEAGEGQAGKNSQIMRVVTSAGGGGDLRRGQSGVCRPVEWSCPHARRPL